MGTGGTLGAAVGLGVRADGGLNLGQNTAGNNVFLGYQAGQAVTSAGASNQFVGYQVGWYQPRNGGSQRGPRKTPPAPATALRP